MHCRRCSQL